MEFCRYHDIHLELEVRNGARWYCPVPGCIHIEEIEIPKKEKGEDAGSTNTQTSSVSDNQNVPVKNSLNESELTVESQLRVGTNRKLANEEPEDGGAEPEHPIEPAEELSKPEDVVEPQLADKDFFDAFEDDFDDSDIN